jgi:hypothetical protein
LASARARSASRIEADETIISREATERTDSISSFNPLKVSLGSRKVSLPPPFSSFVASGALPALDSHTCAFRICLKISFSSMVVPVRSTFVARSRTNSSSAWTFAMNFSFSLAVPGCFPARTFWISSRSCSAWVAELQDLGRAIFSWR